MANINAYAAPKAAASLSPFTISRRDTGPRDVKIDILYCGVCHSDIHQVMNEWGGSIFPMVPGHEIVGRVIRVGDQVKKFKEGDLVGVGCFVDSCRVCPSCQAGEEQYCDTGMTPTYNGYERDGKTHTYGGYSTQIVVDENYVLSVSEKLSLQGVAPLLCAGITTYSPLRHWKVGKGQKVGIVGLGGLGHMGVKFAASFGAEVTVFSTSASKEKDALRLGAHHFANTKDRGEMDKLKNEFDFILNTISAQHEHHDYLQLLRLDGTMVVVGVPPQPSVTGAFDLIGRRRSLAGSLIGGIRETQEMLIYCAEHNITSDVEVIPIQDINTSYERMLKGDVHYRFVIDIASLK